MNKDAKIYVAGHRGMVGSAIVRRLQSAGYSNLVVRTSSELDLTQQAAVTDFLHPKSPTTFSWRLQKSAGSTQTIRIAPTSSTRTDYRGEHHPCGRKGWRWPDVVSLGSSCIYPRDCPQPIKEDYLLTGPLELTNEPMPSQRSPG